jgi:hypothetical protein
VRMIVLQIYFDAMCYWIRFSVNHDFNNRLMNL